jgi:hypothetical protein
MRMGEESMSEIVSKKAGLSTQAHFTITALLKVWDDSETPPGHRHNDLVVSCIGKRNFALYSWGNMVFLGKSAELIAYLRGLLHGKMNMTNL